MSRKIIQFTQLGRFGRFGNQIFQYLFARSYAEIVGAELEIPNWIGQKIFKNCEHPCPSVRLPRTAIDSFNWGDTNIDLFGYFQTEKFIHILSESKIRKWLVFKEEWTDLFKKKDGYCVAAHLRRGDYKTLYSDVFCSVSEKSYIDACDKFGIRKDCVVWLSEENQKIDNRVSSDLQFLPDFFTMINADVLLRANSTFSFWAGFFGKGQVYSPNVRGKRGLCDVEFVKGNHSSVVDVNSDFIFGG